MYRPDRRGKVSFLIQVLFLFSADRVKILCAESQIKDPERSFWKSETVPSASSFLSMPCPNGNPGRHVENHGWNNQVDL